MNYVKNRANQVAVAGTVSAPAGYQFLESLHTLFQTWWPSQPDALWQVILLTLSAALGGGLGKIIRTIEN